MTTDTPAREFLEARERRIKRFLLGSGYRMVDLARIYGMSVQSISLFVTGARPNNPDCVRLFEKIGFKERRTADGSLVGGPRIKRRSRRRHVDVNSMDAA